MVGVEIMAPPGMEEMTNQLQSLFQNLHQGRSKRRKLKVKDALALLKEEEAGRLINQEDVKLQAVKAVEENGIVFIDEIDKIARRAEAHGADVSREGVQRDLLPLVEGCTVSTRYGMVRTDHVLFIASGAFSVAKPSDLIPELQGRFPIRVELTALGVDEFVRILTEPSASLTEQYVSLLATERFDIRSSRAACGGSPRSRSRSTTAARTSARGACTRCSSGCSRRCRSKRPTAAAKASSSMRPTSTRI